jgi:L-lactate permease
MVLEISRRTGILLNSIILFFLAIFPIIVIFVGIVFLKQSGTLMAVIGWLLTMLVAVIFYNTSPAVALYASASGILASFGISLMVLFTILQVTMMDLTGAIRSISEYIRSIAAERYEQIMILNVGFWVVPCFNRGYTRHHAPTHYDGAWFLTRCIRGPAMSRI